jgi:predicted secreted Zn-dependent protease
VNQRTTRERNETVDSLQQRRDEEQDVEEQRREAEPPSAWFAHMRRKPGGAQRTVARKAMRLQRKAGNEYVRERMHFEPVRVSASPVIVAREEAEGESAVKVDAKPTFSTYDVTSTSLAGAFKKIMAYANTHDGEAGSVKWAPSWTMSYDDDGYVKGVTVTARIVKTMPSWTDADKKLSAAALAEWKRVYKELDDHENRHLEILTNGATYIGNSALGSSRKSADKDATKAKDSINADNVAIDPFETVMTTDIE